MCGFSKEAVGPVKELESFFGWRRREGRFRAADKNSGICGRSRQSIVKRAYGPMLTIVVQKTCAEYYTPNFAYLRCIVWLSLFKCNIPFAMPVVLVEVDCQWEAGRTVALASLRYKQTKIQV